MTSRELILDSSFIVHHSSFSSQQAPPPQPAQAGGDEAEGTFQGPAELLYGPGRVLAQFQDPGVKGQVLEFCLEGRLQGSQGRFSLTGLEIFAPGALGQVGETVL